MTRILAFDLWGDYAHYKMVYATTTAVSYPIPVKTSLYGMFGAMLGLEKDGNKYLDHFTNGVCKVGIQVCNPIVMQRWNINLRAVFGAMKESDNRKPTMMEMVYRPHYRIYFSHQDHTLFEELSGRIRSHTSVFTPALGLANLLANYEWMGEWEAEELHSSDFIPLDTAVPKSMFQDLKIDFRQGNQLVEVGQYSLEMDRQRNVTVRDDILFDRSGRPFWAKVSGYFSVPLLDKTHHVVLF